MMNSQRSCFYTRPATPRLLNLTNSRRRCPHPRHRGSRWLLEHVDRHKLEGRELAPGEEVEDVILKFAPGNGQLMQLARLWSHWRGQDEPDLLSFTLVTKSGHGRLRPLPDPAQAGQCGFEVQWNGYVQLSITVPLHLRPQCGRLAGRVGAGGLPGAAR